MNEIIFRLLRYCIKDKSQYAFMSDEYVEYKDQEANDYIYESIKNASSGLMVAKFGTIELETILCLRAYKNGITYKDYWNGICGNYTILPSESMYYLSNNAGFFPSKIEYGMKYLDLVLNDCKDVDILASYQKREKFISNEIKHTVKVNLEGYYAPFLWENPWTRILKDKKVLVIHPFAESIKMQYSRRELLFNNPDVLPEFKSLTVIKAVQSIAEEKNKLLFGSWFDALLYMEREIDKTDFDIALIGCGAYGFDIAAYIKRKGKIAIHTAGWTQMLFGIYGNRWLVDQPKFKKFINNNWIRPLENERPSGLEKVENGAYW